MITRFMTWLKGFGLLLVGFGGLAVVLMLFVGYFDAPVEGRLPPLMAAVLAFFLTIGSVFVLSVAFDD